MGSKACEHILYVLLRNMHHEICVSSPPSLKPSLQKDWKKIFRRSLCEGLGFVTTTLPLLGRCMIDSFKINELIVPPAFKKQKGTKLPKLYYGLFSRIYDSNGVILDDPDIESMRLLNQICFMFYKYETGYTDAQLDVALRGYLDVEDEISHLFIHENSGLFIEAKRQITNLFSDFNPMDIKPSASGGHLATGEVGAEKYRAKRLYSEIHRIYPYYRYFVPTLNSMAEQLKNVGMEPDGYLSWYKSLTRLKSGTSVLKFVNKDSRGPRSISMEPSEYQYIQQGLKDALYKHIERKTNFQINFQSQTKNQKLAIEGSINGNYNTYDFSSASDRVSVELVNYLFRDVPALLDALHACRSTHVELPDGNIIKLKKFAPMGSAICFPVMASVIYSIAKAMNSELDAIVYGDDLILEDDSSYADIVSVYKMFGLVVNEKKSFARGSFRESCGADAFQGNLINPIRIKKDLSCQKPEQFAALVDSSNEFYEAGYWHLAGCLRTYLQSLVSYQIPTLSVRKTAPGLNFFFVTDALEDIRVKINSKTALPEYFRRTLELVVPKRETRLSDEFGYMIALLVGGRDSDVLPSTVVVRDSATKSKLRWKWRRLFYGTRLGALPA